MDKNSLPFLLKRLAELRAQLAALLSARPTTLTPLLKRKSELVVAAMAAKGYKVSVFQGYRSFAEQDYLYAQGRTRPGPIVTNAKGGDSLHNYGVAIDIVFLVNRHASWSNNHPWALLGTVGKSHGLEWGGDWVGFVDRPHFQMLQGYTLQDFKSNKVNYKKYV